MALSQTKQLVVHAVVETCAVKQEVDIAQQAIVSAGVERVEYAHLDIAIPVQQQNLLVPWRSVTVVHQQPDAHAPIRGASQFPRHQQAGGVATEYVVLQIERALGGADHFDAGCEAVDACREQR